MSELVDLAATDGRLYLTYDPDGDNPILLSLSDEIDDTIACSLRDMSSERSATEEEVLALKDAIETYAAALELEAHRVRVKWGVKLRFLESEWAYAVQYAATLP